MEMPWQIFLQKLMNDKIKKIINIMINLRTTQETTCSNTMLNNIDKWKKDIKDINNTKHLDLHGNPTHKEREENHRRS
jgi:hypothetical protein